MIFRMRSSAQAVFGSVPTVCSFFPWPAEVVRVLSSAAPNISGRSGAQPVLPEAGRPPEQLHSRVRQDSRAHAFLSAGAVVVVLLTLVRLITPESEVPRA